MCACSLGLFAPCLTRTHAQAGVDLEESSGRAFPLPASTLGRYVIVYGGYPGEGALNVSSLEVFPTGERALSSLAGWLARAACPSSPHA